jgi:hypothetical protein
MWTLEIAVVAVFAAPSLAIVFLWCEGILERRLRRQRAASGPDRPHGDARREDAAALDSARPAQQRAA